MDNLPPLMPESDHSDHADAVPAVQNNPDQDADATQNGPNAEHDDVDAASAFASALLNVFAQSAQHATLQNQSAPGQQHASLLAAQAPNAFANDAVVSHFVDPETGQHIVHSLGVDPTTHNVVLRRQRFRVERNNERSDSNGDNEGGGDSNGDGNSERDNEGGGEQESEHDAAQSPWTRFEFEILQHDNEDGHHNAAAQESDDANNNQDENDDLLPHVHLPHLLQALLPPMAGGHGNRRQSPFDFLSAATRRQPSCEHESQAFATPADVPIAVCKQCDSVVAPVDAHSTAVRVTPLPLSLNRDDRWSKLLALHADHCQRSLSAVDALLREQQQLLVRLYAWRDAFTNGGPIDYQAQQHPVYQEMERAMKRTLNVTTAFQKTSSAMLAKHRAAVIRAIQRALPQTDDAFVDYAKRQISTALPQALLHPTAGAMCAVCTENRVFVRLHAARARYEQPSLDTLFATAHNEGANDSGANRSDSSRAARRRRGQRQRATLHRQQRRIEPCRCVSFSVCLDCLLKWYWESSEQLRKSFAECPTCRAEFHLEDIVPVYAPQSSAAVETPATPNASQCVEDNESDGPPPLVPAP